VCVCVCVCVCLCLCACVHVCVSVCRVVFLMCVWLFRVQQCKLDADNLKPVFAALHGCSQWCKSPCEKHAKLTTMT
jgi:hypothetical protein